MPSKSELDNGDSPQKIGMIRRFFRSLLANFLHQNKHKCFSSLTALDHCRTRTEDVFFPGHPSPSRHGWNDDSQPAQLHPKTYEQICSYFLPQPDGDCISWTNRILHGEGKKVKHELDLVHADQCIGMPRVIN